MITINAVNAVSNVCLLNFLMQSQSGPDKVGHIITGERFVFCLIGVIFGVVFGLDGWNIGKPNAEFKDSRRTKGLRYGAVGIAVTLFGDLKGIGLSGDRFGMLAGYVLGFVIAALVTIAVIAICLAVKYGRLKSREPENYPPEPFNPVGDYVHLGYDGFKKNLELAVEKLREKQDEKSRQHVRDFVPIYSKAMRTIIVAIEGLNKDPSPENRKALITLVLRSAITTVQAYRQIKDDILNANCMVLYRKDELPAEYKSKIRFHGNDIDRFRQFLVIEHWAEEQGSIDLVFPVEDFNDPLATERSLPGAPLALLHKNLQVIDDTNNMEYPARLHHLVKEEQDVYFKNAEFRSFGCVTIPGQLGVVVIQSTDKNVFGSSKKEKQQTADLLKPFCHALKAALAINSATEGALNG